ncbi:MAG: molecular chaperone DnaJ, partial [candidate division Zixibacteria bacterium]|nr:molecular chaperone DnaJ [candidate division Zixibacteria bacterium]
MPKRDYYEILGIDRGASEDELKSAYRKMAMKNHPDRNPGDEAAESRFKEVSEAYEILKDPQKRQMYDQFGHEGLEQGGGFGGFEGFGGGFDISDALRAFMRDFGGGGGGGSMFDDLFGMGGGGSRRQRNRGEDLRIRVKLSLEEIASGTEKSLRVKRLVKCDACNGSGVAAGSHRKTCPQCRGSGRVRTVSRTILGSIQQVTTCSMCRGTGEVISDPCKVCGGEGRVRSTGTVKIKIPAGVSSGNYMTVDSMGNAAPGNGEPGDLITVFEESEHEFFTRRGDNIICEIPLSFTMAALGGTVSIPTLSGEAQLRIPSGIQPGKVLKMRGKGIPHLHRNGSGDQLVQVTVWVPTKLSANDKEILKELKTSESFRPPEGGKSFFSKLRESFGV